MPSQTDCTKNPSGGFQQHLRASLNIHSHTMQPLQEKFEFLQFHWSEIPNEKQSLPGLKFLHKLARPSFHLGMRLDHEITEKFVYLRLEHEIT